MSFVDDWRGRAPQALQALAADLGCALDALTAEQRAAALLWTIRDRIRAGDSAAFTALRAIAGNQADALLVSIATGPGTPRACADQLAARAAADPAMRGALVAIVDAFDLVPAGPALAPTDTTDGAHYHIDAVQAAAFAPGGEISIQQLNVRQGGPASPPPPLPGPEEIAAGEARLANLPTDDKVAVPEPATFRLAARMPIQPNPLFVGRDDELRALARQLKPSGGAVAVTTGIGGVGKTQLAAEFAHRYGQFFAGGVFWISFANPDAISTAIAAYGGPGALELFRLDDQLTLDQQQDRVQAQWASPLPRLLVFDNCDDWRGEEGQRISGEALLRKWRPPAGGCRVLITSRRASWSPSLGVHAHELDTLQRPASITLLQSLAPSLGHGDAAAIADALGDLPLALFLAGNYLRTYGRIEPPAKYLDRLQALDILDHPSMQGQGTSDVPTERAPHVARAFALSYDRLDPNESVDALAIQLLARAACLAPGEPFPRDLLEATAAEAGDEIARRAVDATDRLLALGLLEAEAEETLRIHRLVSAYAQRTAPSEGAQEVVEDALTNAGNRLVNGGIPSRLLTIIAHLRHALRIADARADARAAALTNATARAEEALLSYAAAKPLYERALALREQALGPSHPDTATSLNNLAVLYAYQGDFDRALPLIERALVIRVRALGAQHPDTIQTQQSLENMRAAAARQDGQPTDPLIALAPLLTAIAAIATGDDAQRPAVEAVLAELETGGWHLSAPVQRIWQGERDPASLATGLDEQDSALVRRILDLIAAGDK